MISIKEQQDLLLDIARNLKKSIVVYAIGGTAMMFFGIKKETKDIDLVFTNQEDRTIFIEIAESLGYRGMNAKIVYGEKLNKPIMLSAGNARFDLFLRDVIGVKFSDSMIERAKETHQYGENLIIKAADVHDLIIMKSATIRSRDEEDIAAICKYSEIDWNILVSEADIQVKLGNERGILELGRLLENLATRKDLEIPKKVLDDLWKLIKKQIDRKIKK